MFEQSLQLRKKFQFSEAIKLIIGKTNEKNMDGQIYSELFRLFLLNQDKTQLEKYFFQLVNSEESKRELDEDVFLRILLAFPEKIKKNKSIIIIPKDYQWLEEFKLNKKERVFQSKVVDCKVKIDGFSYYHFNCKCDSCFEVHSLEIKGTIVINKKYLCPVCLAQQILTFSEIRTKIDKEYPFLIKENSENYIKSSEEKILKIFKDCNQSYSNSPVPRLFRNLNQDIIGLLNQLVLSNLLDNKNISGKK